MVEAILMRETHIRKTDGELVILPKSMLFKNPPPYEQTLRSTEAPDKDMHCHCTTALFAMAVRSRGFAGGRRSGNRFPRIGPCHFKTAPAGGVTYNARLDVRT